MSHGERAPLAGFTCERVLCHMGREPHWLGSPVRVCRVTWREPHWLGSPVRATGSHRERTPLAGFTCEGIRVTERTPLAGFTCEGDGVT